MRISVCVTTYNEEDSIGGLLKSLLFQTKKPDEIVIVDGGSKDRTVDIIRHFQKKDKRIKLLVEKCSRAKGRNVAVEMARNRIIAITDAGCTADRSWLKRITSPFESAGGPLAESGVEMVAGFYRMVAKDDFQKAASVFLGVAPENFDINFLPSTRSIAFKKSLWERVGGFPEKLEGAAEDTVFNYKAVLSGANISRMKSAMVEWGMPASISSFCYKIFNYASGDAKSKIWFFPGKGLSSHNIKTISIFFRYLLALSLLIYSVFVDRSISLYLIFLIFFYFFWAFRKTYLQFRNWRVGLWGVILQLVSDFSAMIGFLAGTIR